MSSAIRSYRDLLVWQRAMTIAEDVYGLTRAFPREEQFGLTSQSRRAAASIAANIAEGHGRGTRAAYANFLRVARGSLRELETHLILAERVGVAKSQSVAHLLCQTDELGGMLHALIERLAGQPRRAPAPCSPLPAPGNA